MKDLQWFPPIPEPRAPAASPVIGSVVVGVAAGGLLLARGHRFLAVAVSVAASILALALSLPTLRRPILGAARWLGAGVGRVATLALLWPFYTLVFGSIRLLLFVARVDLLGLQLHPEWPSYWQPAAPEAKRAQYYHRLFTVEPVRHESYRFAWTIGILAFALIVSLSGEFILRSMGFGHPVVYRLDPRVGYYPAPNQDVRRYGGDIHINAFGMRSRDITAEKPQGTFRILMLGDSTLYGGSYLDQSQIYATRLEELLNRKPGVLPGSPSGVQVLCMGVNAWGPQHELAYVQEFGFFGSDLVMVMGPPDDAYRPRYGIAALPFFDEAHRPRFAWQEFWEHLKWEYKARTAGAEEDLESSPQAGQVVADGIAAWLRIASLAQTQGAHIDFELLPNEWEAREGRAEDSTQRVLETLLPKLAVRNVPYAYPLDLFRNKVGVPKIYHDGAHLDIAGHRIYAGYLCERVMHLASAE